MKAAKTVGRRTLLNCVVLIENTCDIRMYRTREAMRSKQSHEAILAAMNDDMIVMRTQLFARLGYMSNAINELTELVEGCKT